LRKCAVIARYDHHPAAPSAPNTRNDILSTITYFILPFSQCPSHFGRAFYQLISVFCFRPRISKSSQSPVIRCLSH
jgi:hypothetical protein